MSYFPECYFTETLSLQMSEAGGGGEMCSGENSGKRCPVFPVDAVFHPSAFARVHSTL